MLHNLLSFVFCQIALLKFVFCCFLTLNYLDGFVLKKSKNHKNIFSQLQKVSKSFFSWNITFSPQLCQFRRIVLLNFRKRWTTLKKGRHSLATKTKKNSIFFEHHIFFTIFCLLSDCITKLCFLLFFDTKLPWRFWRKTSKTWQKAFFQLQKVVKSFTISWNSTFFLQVPQFRQIVLLNFEKDTKHSKKDLIHLQQKLKRIAFSLNITHFLHNFLSFVRLHY